MGTHIRRAAMDLLARREHSLKELEQKLARRFPDETEQIGHQLAKLHAQGLQSDSRMAGAFIRARSHRGQGPVKISAELRGKGLSEQVISQAFEAEGVDWLALLGVVCERKYGSLASADLKEKGKRARFLQQRGFTFDQINTLLD